MTTTDPMGADPAISLDGAAGQSRRTEPRDDARPSIPCRWCGWRAPHLYASPEKVLADHVAQCPLSVPCDYCGSGQRVRCTTNSGKPAPFHEARRIYS